MGSKTLVLSLRVIGGVMFALVLGIAGNLLTPVAERNSDLVNSFLTSISLQLVLFFLALALWAGLYLALRRIQPNHEAIIPVGRNEEKSDQRARTEQTRELPAFDARLQLFDKVMRINLDGMWAEDVSPWIDVLVYIRNASPYPVVVTGVTGHLLCAGAECQYPARLENAPVKLGPITDYHELRIRQPITTEMQQAFTFQPHKLNLFTEDHRVLFQLSAIHLEGTIESPTGTVPLPRRAVSADNFYVRGPVRETTDDKMLWPFERTFVSQSHYTLIGERRTEEEQPKEPKPRDEQLVLLCNSYAIPAFDALNPVLRDVFNLCFSNGGWQGLSAKYFRDYAFEPEYGEALHNMQEGIADGSPGDLERAFIRYCGIYLLAGAFVWHSSRIGTMAEVGAIGQWVKRHEALIDQVKILSGGIDREGLKTFLLLNHEFLPMPREVLNRASS